MSLLWQDRRRKLDGLTDLVQHRLQRAKLCQDARQGLHGSEHEGGQLILREYGCTTLSYAEFNMKESAAT